MSVPLKIHGAWAVLILLAVAGCKDDPLQTQAPRSGDARADELADSTAPGMSRPSGDTNSSGALTEADRSGSGSGNAATKTPSLEAMTLDELLLNLQNAMDDRDLDLALPLAERVVSLQPDHGIAALLPELYATQAMNLVREGKRKEANPLLYQAATAARELNARRQLNATEQTMLAGMIYNEACAFAVDGKQEQALSSLREAFETGFDDLELARTDEDFSSLRGTDSYQEILQQAGLRMAQQGRDEGLRKMAEFPSFSFLLDLPDLDGKPIKTADFAGQVLIVNFWGSWSEPCREQITHLMELKTRYGKRGLALVGVNYERGVPDEAKSSILAYTKQAGIDYPCVIGDEDTRDQVPNFSDYPTTLLVDRKGKCRMALKGLQPLQQLESLVISLLDEDDGTDGGGADGATGEVPSKDN